jgi:hypothetical protein
MRQTPSRLTCRCLRLNTRTPTICATLSLTDCFMCYFERLCRIMFFLFEHSSSWTALVSVRSLRYGGKWFVDHLGLLPTVGICFCSSFRYFSQYIFSIFPMYRFPLIHCLFGCVFEVELPSHRYQQPLSKKEGKKERKSKEKLR